ncbi:MAG: PIN domain-containing protein [Armatimonadetes bacterium]|nr:PIN domain-containing protein [Armatimonadota bacterium]
MTIPVSGRIYVDSNVVIYSVERHPTYGPILQPFWDAVSAGDAEAVTSTITVAEVLVGPIRMQRPDLVALYERMLSMPGLDLAPLSHDIGAESARLRAEFPRLRTPDAIHLATASLSGCSAILTNDVALRQVAGVPVLTLG